MSSNVKKVNPYPIEIQLNGQPGQIVKLATTGFLVQTEHPLKVNQEFQTDFLLPVMNRTVSFRGQVIKTYDRFRGQLGEDQQNQKLAEVYFRELPPESMNHIRQFLLKIGQVR